MTKEKTDKKLCWRYNEKDCKNINCNTDNCWSDPKDE